MLAGDADFPLEVVVADLASYEQLLSNTLFVSWTSPTCAAISRSARPRNTGRSHFLRQSRSRQERRRSAQGAGAPRKFARKVFVAARAPGSAAGTDPSRLRAAGGSRQPQPRSVPVRREARPPPPRRADGRASACVLRPAAGRHIGGRASSGGAPRVVDHEAPTAVALATEDVCVLRLEAQRLAVRPSPRERPDAGDER